MCHRAARAARPQEQRASARRIGQALAQAFGKAPKIGVVPAPFAIGKDNGIDRADLLRGRRQIVQQRDHLAFEREGDVETRKAFGLGGLDHLAQAGRLLHRIGVEQIIAVVQPMRAPFGNMHGRRARQLDAPSDQADADLAQAGFGRNRGAVLIGARGHVVQSSLDPSESPEPASNCNARLNSSTTFNFSFKNFHATQNANRGGKL